MDSQSTSTSSCDGTPITVNDQLPVVVTPLKDTTTGTSQLHDTDKRSNVANVELLTSIEPDDGMEEDEDEKDRSMSIATSTSSSPLLISTKEAVTTNTKKRPASISDNDRNISTDTNSPLLKQQKQRNKATTTTATTATTSPPSAIAKNWKQASMVHAELAALKQRGLAKLLNQHFTTTAQQLAIEKAAADAAVLDLQQRKARTSTFTPTNSSEISPLDQAYIQANKWRAECRRKERETLLLYQQYVHKFGPTTVLPIPTVPTKHENVATSKHSSHVIAPTAPIVPPTQQQQPLQPKQPLPPRPVSTLVPNMAAQIESTLEEYCARGAIAHPSIMMYGTEQTYSSVATKEEFLFREHYRKQLEAKGADAVCSPGYYKGDGKATFDVFTYNQNNNEQDENHVNRDDWNYDNNDVCSLVSGLTTLHSAMTREFIYDCEHSVQTFLRDEQETVRKMLEQEENDASHSSGDTHSSNILIVQDSDATAKAAENMVQQMHDILQEYQKNHFVDPADTTNPRDPTITGTNTTEPKKVYPFAFPTNNSNEQWMVYYDECYHQEYYHEVHTNRTQWDPPGMKMKSATNNVDPPDTSYSSNSYDEDFLLYSTDDRMDRILDNNNSRVMAFRKRQRRKRRRRRIFVTLIISILICMVSCGAYYFNCNPTTVGSAIDNNKPSMCTIIDDFVIEKWHQFTNKESHSMEEESIGISPKQCILRLEDEIATLYQKQQQQLFLQENVTEKVVIHRPWGCNIPFAYLFHSKCRRIASLHPVFDLQALINSMLQ
jgi:hypothetical protein